MPMDRFLPLDGFNGGGDGVPATVAIPVGKPIDDVTVSYSYSVTGGSEFDKTHFDYIQLILNTETIVDITGEEAAMLDAYAGRTENTGYLNIPLRDILARTFDGVQASGLVTLPTDNLVLKVKFSGTGAGNARTLGGFVTFSEFNPGVREVIPKIFRHEFAATAAGPYQITTMPKGPRILRAHFSSAQMNGLKILRDRDEVFNLSKAENEHLLKRNGRVPQTDYYHFDPTMDGFNLAKMFRTASNNLLFECDMLAADTVPILVQSFWPGEHAGGRVANTPAVIGNQVKKRFRGRLGRR